MEKINRILAHHAGAKLFRHKTGRYPSSEELVRLLQHQIVRQQGIPYHGDIEIAQQVLSDVEGLQWDLGQLYDKLQHSQAKKGLGQVFTPYPAVNATLDMVNFTPTQVLDPACGTGEFLLAAGQRWPQARIMGVDIDPLVLMVASSRLAIADVEAELITDNALTRHWPEEFDLVVGNPPWGSKLSSQQAEGFSLVSRGLRNSFVYFLELTVELLSPGGYMALILPEAFTKVWGYRHVRYWMLQHFSISALHYIPQLFTGHYAPAILVAARRRPAPQPRKIAVGYQRRLRAPVSSHTIPCQALTVQRFNINWCADIEELWCHCQRDCHYMVEATLGSELPAEPVVVDFSLGIVTGDNQRHVKLHNEPGLLPLLTAEDVNAYSISSPQRWLKFQRQSLQQAAPLAKYQVPVKIVYKFIAREIMAAVDYSGALVLNNLNIIIPLRLEFPVEYLVALLNSKLLNTLYMYKFFTGKVLTRALKQLPLQVGSEAQVQQVAKKAKSLAQGQEGQQQEQLDALIYSLYGLSSRQRTLVEQWYSKLKAMFFV